MQVELRCPACLLHFRSDLDTAALERIHDEGPWSALGDGETFEDRIHADLLEHQEAYCPRCGNEVAATEESLGELATELLAHW
jgi:hypothetical protein